VLQATPAGLYCPAGDFHIDPVAPEPGEVPVERAVLTHAHADHARAGHGRYYCSAPSLPLVRHRFARSGEAGAEGASIEGVPYGVPFQLGAARVSFHPSGHILGAAQVRVEVDGEVWCATGDFKRAPDPTCAPFEVVRCDVLVTESTFGLPIYRWEPTRAVVGAIAAWWEACADAERAAVLFAYPLGKSQRILAELRAFTDRRVLVHGALVEMIARYREAGVAMLETAPALDETEPKRGRGARRSYAGELVLAPPSAKGSPWLRRFGDCEIAFASGHMQLRGTRRRRGFDRGFVLSDHADWLDLLATARESGARRVLTTHGHAEPLARYLREQGLDAAPLVAPSGVDEERS
jgi:putative mRNA 3-end processing factor